MKKSITHIVARLQALEAASLVHVLNAPAPQKSILYVRILAMEAASRLPHVNFPMPLFMYLARRHAGNPLFHRWLRAIGPSNGCCLGSQLLDGHNFITEK